MRLNWNSRLVGSRVVLHPFVAPFVPKYHDWMEDEWLRDMTASERLTLDEEFEMQAAWVDDEQKATFIVFDRHAMADSDSLGSGVGHKLEGALTGDVRGMVGDVNIFLLSEDECEEYGDAAVKLHQAAQPAVDSPCVPAPAVSRWRVAEIMIMIAEPSARRVGLAREAATMMMEWGRRNLDISCYVAKITASNAPSIALFSHKLGFTEAKRVAAFDEVHLVGPILSGPLVDDRDEGYREQAVTHAYEAAPL